MNLDGATALVTGANRGFGRHLAAELVQRGATVYAGARDPTTVELPGARPVLSWFASATFSAYSVAKSAEWAMTNALRLELADRNIVVSALHVGFMDTDMIQTIDAPKSDPADIARIALDGVQDGAYEIVADDTSRRALAGLSGGVAALYPQLP